MELKSCIENDNLFCFPNRREESYEDDVVYRTSEKFKELKSFEIEVDHSFEHATSKFNNIIQFWLSCLSFSVGYGNIWRFPYLLYSNGGGAFIIAFAVCIIILAYPIFFMEIAYGKAFRRNTVTIFEGIRTKLFGQSIAVYIMLFFEAALSICLASWCCSYFLMSFVDPLPWHQSNDDNLSFNNFFRDKFLNVSTGIFDINFYIPIIIISSTIMCLLIFITTFRGIESIKYAVYIIIPLPYILMIILFFKALTLEGISIGWKFLFNPDWSKIFTLKIWKDAASQVLFSTGIGNTVMIHLSSFRKDEQPINYSSMGIPTLNFLTSLLCSLSLYAFIGHASHVSGIDIKDFPIDGIDLSFVFYPALLATMPYANMWSILFFLMLMLVGISTVYSLIEVISSFFIGIQRKYRKQLSNKSMMIFCILLIIYIFNVGVFCTNAGYHWVKLFDHYTIGMNRTILTLTETIIIVYFLPLEELEERVEDINEYFPKFYKFMIKFICPLFCFMLFLFGVIDEIKNPPEYTFMARIFGLFVFILPISVFGYFFYYDPLGYNSELNESLKL